MHKDTCTCVLRFFWIYSVQLFVRSVTFQCKGPAVQIGFFSRCKAGALPIFSCYKEGQRNHSRLQTGGPDGCGRGDGDIRVQSDRGIFLQMVSLVSPKLQLFLIVWLTGSGSTNARRRSVRLKFHPSSVCLRWGIFDTNVRKFSMICWGKCRAWTSSHATFKNQILISVVSPFFEPWDVFHIIQCQCPPH